MICLAYFARHLLILSKHKQYDDSNDVRVIHSFI
jgi:hypothetical protein